MSTSDFGHDHMYWAGLWWLLFVVLVVVVATLFAKKMSDGASSSSNSSAEELVKQRYAKGEITKKEYQEIIKTISK